MRRLYEATAEHRHFSIIWLTLARTIAKRVHGRRCGRLDGEPTGKAKVAFAQDRKPAVLKEAIFLKGEGPCSC